jgi:hypothetical protein
MNSLLINTSKPTPDLSNEMLIEGEEIRRATGRKTPANLIDWIY